MLGSHLLMIRYNSADLLLLREHCGTLLILNELLGLIHELFIGVVLCNVVHLLGLL